MECDFDKEFNATVDGVNSFGVGEPLSKISENGYDLNSWLKWNWKKDDSLWSILMNKHAEMCIEKLKEVWFLFEVY